MPSGNGEKPGWINRAACPLPPPSPAVQSPSLANAVCPTLWGGREATLLMPPPPGDAISRFDQHCSPVSPGKDWGKTLGAERRRRLRSCRRAGDEERALLTAAALPVERRRRRGRQAGGKGPCGLPPCGWRGQKRLQGRGGGSGRERGTLPSGSPVPLSGAHADHIQGQARPGPSQAASLMPSLDSELTPRRHPALPHPLRHCPVLYPAAKRRRRTATTALVCAAAPPRAPKRMPNVAQAAASGARAASPLAPAGARAGPPTGTPQ